MRTELIFQIAAVGLISNLLVTVLKSIGKEEQAQWLTIVSSLVVLLFVMGLYVELFDSLRYFLTVIARY